MNNYYLSGKNKFLLTCFFKFFLITFSFLIPSLVSAQCANGSYDDIQYATVGSSTVLGVPDGTTNAHWTSTSVEFSTPFTTGAEIIVLAKGKDHTVDGGRTYIVELSSADGSETASFTFSSTFIDGDTSTFIEFKYILMASESGSYTKMKLGNTGTGGMYSDMDAITVKTPTCYTCKAGAGAPILSKSTGGGNPTFNLSTVNITNTAPAGTTVTWHTGTPATTANKVTPTMAAIGTYYAAFYHTASDCYSYYTAIFNVIADNDNDGIPDVVDVDDDNDGIPDIIECPNTELLVNGGFDYTLEEVSALDPSPTDFRYHSADGLTRFKNRLNDVKFKNPTTGLLSPQGKYQNWDFGIPGSSDTPDWSQAQYLAGSSASDPRLGGSNKYKINIKQSNAGGGFLIFSLSGEKVEKNMNNLKVGETYVFEFEMGSLPNYRNPSKPYSYDINYLSYGFLGGATILHQTPLDTTVYTFDATTPNVSTTFDPHWKKYRIVFVANQTSLVYQFLLNGETVALVDSFSLKEVDNTCTNDTNTDSDGDGCADGVEAGLTPADITGGVGLNGLYDSLETFPDSGILKDPIDLTTNPYDKDKQGSDCSSSDPCKTGAILGTVTANDADADGINNVCDLDDDNDGILDTDENINNKNPDTDADADGIPFYLDDDDTDAAIGDVNNKIEADFDTDNDGIPNHLDLDADNDGIYDIVEADATVAHTNGVANDSDGDYSDTDGVPDTAFWGFGLTPTNTNITTGNPADFLNIDSDGDGCSDANEAYNNANTDTNSDGTYGGVITSAEVNANGLVTGLVYKAPNKNYTTVSYINSVCYIDICTEATGTDTDGEGINDICDIDIDNDGILNENENCNSPVWGTAPLTWIAKDDSGTITLAGGIDMSIDITTTASGDLDASGGTALNLSATGTGTLGTLDDLGIFFDPADNQGASPVKIQIDFTEKMYNLNFKITDIDAGGSGLRIDKVTITSDVGNPILTKVSETSSSFTVANNQATAIRYVTSDKDNKGTILVQVPDGAKSITIIYEEVGTVSNPGVRGIGILGDLHYCLDTDNDGTPDSNDSDSDNDGCPDAVEANENVTSAQLDVNKRIDIANQGGVDTNGVPNLVNSGGTADGSNNTQGQQTNTAVLTATKIEVKTQPTNKVICLGGNAIFTAEMLSKSTTIFNAGVPDYTGIVGNTTGLVYQWEEQIEGTGSWNVISNGGIYSNATTASLKLTNPPVTASTNKYRLVTTSTSNTCAEVISDEVEIVVNPTSVAGTIAGAGAVCTGTNSTELTLSGHTGTVVKWQSSTDNF
ncbi:hypothetical protein G1K70_10000, partial [Tenacibaculum finnmarkense]|nr:hypothetical protein [Tenacibaculum finnmarkense]